MLRINSEKSLRKQASLPAQPSLSAHEQTEQKIKLYIEDNLVQSTSNVLTFLNLIGYLPQSNRLLQGEGVLGYGNYAFRLSPSLITTVLNSNIARAVSNDSGEIKAVCISNEDYNEEQQVIQQVEAFQNVFCSLRLK